MSDEGEVMVISSSEAISADYNSESCNSVDGSLVKIADEYAAYLEASHSLYHGIESRDLQFAKEHYEKKYSGKVFLGVPIGILFEKH
jgi:putative hydrolase of HD superfamily